MTSLARRRPRRARPGWCRYLAPAAEHLRDVEFARLHAAAAALLSQPLPAPLAACIDSRRS